MVNFQFDSPLMRLAYILGKSDQMLELYLQEVEISIIFLSPYANIF